MLAVPEYKLDGFDEILTEDDVCSPSETKWFCRQLDKLAGKNRFGGPNLALRWGVTYIDPMSADETAIKYLDCVQFGKQYGERRWFIEIWRSPEFLKQSGRYQHVAEPDSVVEFYFCKACDAQIKVSAETLNHYGAVPKCDACGSTRSRTELIRESGGGRLLKEFPVEGCYDYWLRLERADLTYYPLDQQAVTITKALWEWELKPQNERDALEQADREIARRREILAHRQQRGNTPQFGSGLILPAHYSR